MNTARGPVRLAVAGGLVGLLGVVAMPRPGGSLADQVAAVAAEPGRFLVGTALTYVATALIGVALVVLGRQCLGLGRRTGGVVTVLAGVGWLVHTTLVSHNAAFYEVSTELERGEAVALAESLYAGPVFLGILLPMLLLSVVGTVAAGVLLWRARLATAWAAAALALAMVADVVTPEEYSGIPMFALLTLGFLGLRPREEVEGAAPAASDEALVDAASDGA